MENIRKQHERKEEKFLSDRAVLSRNSKGRKKLEEKCDIRTDFQRDRDRIMHSKSFRRLKHKTQVFISPEGDHFRTRLTHTLEVSQIARTIARGLNLNEDLTEAIAVGHDLGHTPFGHAGEAVLNDIVPGGFKHNEQSLRVVDYLEADKGLNLTEEVREGILCHTGPKDPETLEGQIVKIADRIAYINHDIDDAIRGEVLDEAGLPSECLGVLGSDHRARINRMVNDIIINSSHGDKISMSSEVLDATNLLRRFLFDNVYVGSIAKAEENKAKRLIEELYDYYLENREVLPEVMNKKIDVYEEILERIVCDYIAGMTDRFAISQYKHLFVPKGFQV